MGTSVCDCCRSTFEPNEAGRCSVCVEHGWDDLHGVAEQSILQIFLHAPPPVRKAVADACGWFWIPCPLCEKHFSGLEWTVGGSIPTDDKGTRRGVCPRCRRRAREITEAAADGDGDGA